MILKLRLKLPFILFLFSMPPLVYADLGICDSESSRAALARTVSSPINHLINDTFRKAFGASTFLLIGEAHFYTEILIIKNLITKFREVNGPNGCVAFEFTSSAEAGEKFLKKIESARSELLEMVIAPGIDKNDQRDLVEMIDNFDQLLTYYGPLVEFALSKRLKTKAIDHPDHPFTESKTDDERNLAMADNLNALVEGLVPVSVRV